MHTSQTELFCFSHLRWSFVFQRPQHLMSRFAVKGRVHYFEEPVFEDKDPELREQRCEKTGVTVLTPVLPHGIGPQEAVEAQHNLLLEYKRRKAVDRYVSWYYTPMALDFTGDLKPEAIVYDCMDELSAFAGAPPAMKRNEELLLSLADLVFTGGTSLYEAKRGRHSAVYQFPSSVDVPHFAKAQAITEDPEDQKHIDRPRLGFVGVIDERLDIDLLSQLASARPQWQIIMIGPVVKISTASLPHASNIHYLGMKRYDDLPAYLAGWDVAMLPFALNASTRFISPTKTPEYLAAGLPVVSTPIRDVVRPYGDLGLVSIGDTPSAFIAAAERLLLRGRAPSWQSDVKAFLGRLSWDKTWHEMSRLIDETLASKSVRNVEVMVAARSAHV